jgi:predicted DNA-binding WGR domain protein
VSLGQMDAALGILDSLCPAPKKAANTTTDDLLNDIANTLQQKGYTVQKWIGQSYFQCHLGIKLKPEDKTFQVGIIIDDDAHYANNNILEQYFLRQQLMQNFGWTIYPLFAKDWIRNEAKVLQDIEHLLKGEQLTLETNFAFPDFKPIETLIEETQQAIEDDKLKSENAGQIDFVHLEAETESGKKYWEAFVTNNQLIVTFGRINSKGQKLIKDFFNQDEARKELQKLKSQKLKKGYS